MGNTRWPTRRQSADLDTIVMILECALEHVEKDEMDLALAQLNKLEGDLSSAPEVMAVLESYEEGGPYRRKRSTRWCPVVDGGVGAGGSTARAMPIG